MVNPCGVNRMRDLYNRVKRCNIVAVVIMLLVSQLVQVLVPFQSAWAAAPVKDDENKKVYVCKYVEQGDKEHLQTGQNPTEVSVNTISGTVEPGSYFGDGQDRSYVIGYVPMSPEPTVLDCPKVINAAAITITQTLVCKGNNDILTAAPVDHVTFSMGTWSNNSRTVTATIDAGYSWSDGTKGLTKTYTFTDKNTECVITKIPTPATPGVIDLCNVDAVTSNIRWDVPPTDAQFSWTVQADGHLVVTILTPDTTFNDGTTTHDYGVVAADSGIVCATTTAPTASDKCGLVNDTYMIPAVTGIEYRVAGTAVTAGSHSTGRALSVTITAVAKTGYELKGDASWTLDFTNARCTPKANVVSTIYCHPDGQAFSYGIINTSDSDQRYMFIVTDASGAEVERLPAANVPYDHIYYSYWLTSTDGTYTISLYAVTDTDAIMGDALWTTTMKTVCAHDVFTPEIYKRDQFGKLLPGAKFTVKVCQLDTRAEAWTCETYTNVDLGTMGNWFSQNVKYKKYQPTEVTITETAAPGACKIAGPWTHTWDYTDSDVLYEGAWNTGRIWNMYDECPIGNGSQKPPVTTTGVTELPHTGASATAPILAIVAAALTYGAVYFAQPRRQFEE